MGTEVVTLTDFVAALGAEPGPFLAQCPNLVFYFVIYFGIPGHIVDVFEDRNSFILITGLKVAVILLGQYARLEVEFQFLEHGLNRFSSDSRQELVSVFLPGASKLFIGQLGIVFYDASCKTLSSCYP
jgi:hypothetical protein